MQDHEQNKVDNTEPVLDEFLASGIVSPDAGHNIIKKLIPSYLALTFCFPAFFLSLIPFLCLANLSKGIQVSIIVLFYLVIFHQSIVVRALKQAAILWAHFKDSEEPIEEKEMELIRERFSPYDRLGNRLWQGTMVFLFFNVSYLYQNYNWQRATVILICILLLLLIASTWNYLNYRRKFYAALHINLEQYKTEYRYNWKNDRVDRIQYTRKTTVGDVYFICYLCFLVILKFRFPENIYFNIYFFLITIFTGVAIASAKSLRNQYTPPSIRKPLSPRLSRIFSWHIIHLSIVDLIWHLVATFAIYFVVIPFTSPYYWLYALGVLFLVENVNRFFVSKGTILVIKRIIDRNFNIVVFRRFDKEASLKARTVVYPTLGAYGQIYSIKDEHLESAQSTSDSANILGEYYALEYSTNANWQYNVNYYLSITDLIVFYWTRLPTENMLWEFERSVATMPPERLLIITDTGLVKQVISELDTRYPGIDLRKINLIDIDQYNSYNSFGKKVQEIMKQLQPARRNS